MTILAIALTALAAAIALTLLLPRSVRVERRTHMPMTPEEVIARVSSTEGFQSFNPYLSADPDLKIAPFGPASGVGSGFRFDGKDGKGTQTVTEVTDTRVTYLIDLGAMGKPVQTISVTPAAGGADVTWSVTSDMGFNPVFRVFGLFMDRMLGDTYERGLTNLKALA